MYRRRSLFKIYIGVALLLTTVGATSGATTNSSVIATPNSVCAQLMRAGRLTNEEKAFLKGRYDIDPEQLQLTAGLKIPVLFHMAGPETLAPKPIAGAPMVRDQKKYDVVIVGSGAAGLTLALRLAKEGWSVLMLERNSQLGGLGMGSTVMGYEFAGGAAYSTGFEKGLQMQIAKEIGLDHFERNLAIHEPIDSFLWKGQLYRGIWEETPLHDLPASFELFKHALLHLDAMGATKKDGAKARWADGMYMADLVRQMPKIVGRWSDDESKRIVDRFNNDKRLDRRDPMKDVLALLDNYGRSALGGPAAEVPARIFMNFYISEITRRYTGGLGTGTIMQALIQTINEQYPGHVEFKTSAPVVSLENVNGGARAVYIENGKMHEVFSEYAELSASVTLAPSLVPGLAKGDPQKFAAIKTIKDTDYSVQIFHVEGHPFRSTYDTWPHNGGDNSLPSDFILSRWMDPSIEGYHNIRDFSQNPRDTYGGITAYHPLGLHDDANWDPQRRLRVVDVDYDSMMKNLGPLVAHDGQKIKVDYVESYFWPKSIQIMPLNSLDIMPLLERPFGRIHFANNSLSAPELEPTMEIGWRAAEALISDRAAAARRP